MKIHYLRKTIAAAIAALALLVDHATAADLTLASSTTPSGTITVNTPDSLTISVGSSGVRTLSNAITLGGGTLKGGVMDNVATVSGLSGSGTSSTFVDGNGVTIILRGSGTANTTADLSLASGVTITGANQLLVGGGGGGGGGRSSRTDGGGGGGGNVVLTTGNLSGTTTLTAGGGGAAGFTTSTTGSGAGGAGNTTSIGATTASGGGGAAPSGGTPTGKGGNSGRTISGTTTTFTGGDGFTATSSNAGGGGGAGSSANGAKGVSTGTGGAGGAGTQITTGVVGLSGYLGSNTFGGGGGGGGDTTAGAGGAGGGGAGATNTLNLAGVAGTNGFGGGGGGGANGTNGPGGAGGAGSVAIQYAYDSNVAAGALTLSGGITLDSTSTLDAVRSGGLIDVTSAITGAGGLDIASSASSGGVVRLSAANTYTGATTISGGILSINDTSALQGTSGVTIAGGAGMTYTGGAATFGKNVTVSAGSGTGTIRNSGGLLTLSGNLSKDNSVLRLTGGAFNVTGTISGTTAGTSDLLVDGTSSVTLSAANTYNGPTFVIESSTLAYGINNAIPSNSVVTLGNASSQGTLSMSGYTGEIGGLVFGSAGGTLRLAATSTSAAPLTASSGTMTLTNGTLDLAGSGTTAGLYRVLSAQSIAGAFTNITGTSAAYQVITSATSVDYQQRAVLGAVSVTNPVVSIITGGSAAFTYTVANSALSGGASLGFTGAGLSNVAGSSSGTAAAGGSSGAISGLVFTGTSVGAGQTGAFTVNAPTAFGETTATGTVAVTVLDHATSSLSSALAVLTSSTISLGTWDYQSQAWTMGTGTNVFSIFNLNPNSLDPSLVALLDLTGASSTGDTGFTLDAGLTPGSFAMIAGGTSASYSVSYNPVGMTTQGTYYRTFTFNMADQNLPGSTATNTLTITAAVIVVPEPGAIALAGVGIALTCWTGVRRRCRSAL